MEHIVFDLVSKLEPAVVGWQRLGCALEPVALPLSDVEMIVYSAEQNQDDGEVAGVQGRQSPMLKGLHGGQTGRQEGPGQHGDAKPENILGPDVARPAEHPF